MSEEERIRKSWSDKLDRLEAGDFSDWFKDTTQVLVGLDRERTICNTKIPPNVTSVFKYDGEKWVFDSMTGHVTTWKSRTGCISEAFERGVGNGWRHFCLRYHTCGLLRAVRFL